jgi:hypothetical protein
MCGKKASPARCQDMVRREGDFELYVGLREAVLRGGYICRARRQGATPGPRSAPSGVCARALSMAAPGPQVVRWEDPIIPQTAGH